VGAAPIEARGAVLGAASVKPSARAAPRHSSTKKAATAIQRAGIRMSNIQGLYRVMPAMT
jgi:hypothetical protein